jgi:hypothetical protein
VTDYDIDDPLPMSLLGSLVWLAAAAVLLAAWAVLAVASALWRGVPERRHATSAR